MLAAEVAVDGGGLAAAALAVCAYAPALFGVSVAVSRLALVRHAGGWRGGVLVASRLALVRHGGDGRGAVLVAGRGWDSAAGFCWTWRRGQNGSLAGVGTYLGCDGCGRPWILPEHS